MAKPRLLVALLTASLGVCPVLRAQSAVDVVVDAAAAGTPLNRVWSYHGYDEPNYTTIPEGVELLRALSAAHRAPFYVRSHFLFNTGDGTPAPKWGSTNIYTEDGEGRPVYDYTLIDGIMDATLESGALPLFELGFMPRALSTRPDPYENSATNMLDGGCFYPPQDYAKWGQLVTAWATHVKERYPGAEATWQWELWNEPDLPYWQGTLEEFLTLYDYTEAALHAVMPEASLGGPAVAGSGTLFFRRFLEHCATGTNAVTGQTGTRLDMVSFHAKGGVSITNGHVQMNLGNQLRQHRSGFAMVAARPEFARTPIVISEADPEGCAACPITQVPANTYRNSSAYGAYVVATMKRSLELADEAKVNLRGILSWAFTFPGTPYFAGYRALSTNGIHLPVFNAFKLLGRLGSTRVPATSSGARPLADLVASGVRQEPDVDVLATIEGERVQVLVWHYHDHLVAAEAAPLTVRVALPPSFGDRALVTHTRVDETHGNAFTTWTSQGSPPTPSVDQLAELRRTMEPVELESARVMNVKEGAVLLSFPLPRFGLSLLTLEPARGVEPTPTASESGCSCRSTAVAKVPLVALLLLPIALTWRRRFGQRR